MCTVSWQFNQEGYTLFFNRDEQRSRAEAVPPVQYQCEVSNTKWLAPLDPDGGGTWAFANNCGLSAVILNDYSEDIPPKGGTGTPRSRGRLLQDLAPAPNARLFLQSLNFAIRRAIYRPFMLLALDPERGPLLHRWTGAVLLRIAVAQPFITTSSFQTELIEEERLDFYLRHVAFPLAPQSEELDRLHRWHDPRDGARSIVMARPDARTVSRTEIAVGPTEVKMTYRAAHANSSTPTLGSSHLFQMARRDTSTQAAK